jgi:hypothetical protein
MAMRLSTTEDTEDTEDMVESFLAERVGRDRY